jgi:hypothetical protein
MRPHNLSCYAGSMAFLSTPSDLVRFGLAIDSGKLLQPATVQVLRTSQQLTSGQKTGYGLGWALKTVTLVGEPAQAVGGRRAVGREGDVLDDVSRTRDRRGRDVEHLVRGHIRSVAESRRGVRGTQRSEPHSLKM